MRRPASQRIKASRLELENPYAHLNSAGGYDAVLSDDSRAEAPTARLHCLRGRAQGRASSQRNIERIARDLQRMMWVRREEIFGSADIDPVEILDPVVALRFLGYDVAMYESLGQHIGGRDSFEVAGIVDNDNKEVRISRRYSPALRNFTAAHELGHVLLHEGSGLHRDRAPDGSAVGIRESREKEADIFASYFLLPEKQLRVAFAKRFLTERFEVNEATAFALDASSLQSFRARCRTPRDLARMLAGAQQYHGRHFESLAERFLVSIEVMAIRLEELDLARLRS